MIITPYSTFYKKLTYIILSIFVFRILLKNLLQIVYCIPNGSHDKVTFSSPEIALWNKKIYKVPHKIWNLWYKFFLSTTSFSLQHPYILQQTGNENIQTYQVEAVILI